MISLQNVSKRFGNLTAAHPLSISVETGKTTVLIGPSGCGKSTLLRMVIGLIEPDTGEVWIGNERMTSADALRLRRTMGYVIQDGGLFPHLTARQNIELMAQEIGQKPSDREKRVRELCDLAHFPVDALDRYPLQLSGGQRQRVSLMRGLMLDPDILLLDEPLGALDPMVRAALQTDLRDIFRELGKTVLLVTHDMGEAGYLGDHLVLMREGRIVQQGSLDDLINRPADPFVSEFISAQRSVVSL